MTRRTPRRLCALCLALALLAGCELGDSAQRAIERANEHIAAADYGAAEAELRSALQQDANSAQARWLLGMVLHRLGDNAAAAAALSQALQQGWARDSVLPSLAQVLLLQDEYYQVEDLPVSGLGAPAESSLRVSRALAAAGLGDFDRADEELELALELTPGSLEARVAVARLNAERGFLFEARELADKLVAEAPDDARAWALQGGLRARDGDLDGALQAYTQAVDLMPIDYASLIKRALIYLKLEDFEAAQGDARRLLHRAPRSPAGPYVQGFAYYQNRQYAEAVQALRGAERGAAEFPDVYFLLGSASLMLGELEQAARYAENYRGMHPGSIRGRKLLAVIRLQQGDYAAVEPLLRPVLEQQPDDVEVLNLVANALLRTERTHEGLDYLQRVVDLQPASPLARLRLGAGYLLGGREADADAQIDIALDLDPQFQQAEVLRVLGYVRQGDFDGAIAAAAAYRDKHPYSTIPLNLLGRVCQEAGRPREAEKAFREALALDPANPAANLNLAHAALQRGDAEAARGHYAAILAQRADYLPALTRLALLQRDQGDAAGMRATLARAIAAHPQALAPRLLLGRHYLAAGQPRQVPPLFAQDGDEAWGPEALLLLAQARIAASEFDAARRTLDQLAARVPDNAQLHHLRAMTLAARPAEMEAELHRALAIDPDYLPSAVALARAALYGGRGEDFQARLAQLVASAPDHPDVLLLRAAAARRAGDDGAALQMARRAHEVAPDAASVQALGALLGQGGQPGQAADLYRQWLQAHPRDLGVRMSLAAVLGDGPAAVREYRQVLDADPDNVAALNNLAWLTRAAAPAQALGYARRAAQLAPASAAVWDTLAVVEYDSGELDAAATSIGRALALDPGAASLRYHGAMIDAARGDASSARRELQAVLGEGAPFAGRADAQALLDSLSP